MPLSDREFVVARYNEDVSWLSRVPVRTTVYDKSPRPLEDAPEGVTVIPRPNVGREAETFLHHIVEKYDALAPITLFAQGWPFQHSPDFLERLDAPFEKPTCLTFRYAIGDPLHITRVKESIEYGRYVALADGAGPGVLGNSIDATAAWNLVFRMPRPEHVWYGYGAMYAVPRAFIHARPLRVWEWLYAMNAETYADGRKVWLTTPGLNAWVMELLWAYLYAGPAEYPTLIE